MSLHDVVAFLQLAEKPDKTEDEVYHMAFLFLRIDKQRIEDQRNEEEERRIREEAEEEEDIESSPMTTPTTEV
jgi:hypothetical protein